MRRLRKFLRLSVAEQRLLSKAALLLGMIGLGLKLLPFRTLRRLVDRLSKPVGKARFSIEQVSWAVELAGCYVPGTCLSRALAAQVLLARQGHPAVLHIGVLRERKSQFMAHAWLESGGQVVIGGYELDLYAPLATLEGKKP
jgi:hypothetical protein